MTDRIDKILSPLEAPVSDSPSSNAYISRILEQLAPEIEATNNKTINADPEDVPLNSKKTPDGLAVEVYEPKLVNIGFRGSNGSSIGPNRIGQTRPVQLFRLDDVKPLSSSVMGKLVEHRAKEKVKKHGSRQKDLALAA